MSAEDPEDGINKQLTRIGQEDRQGGAECDAKMCTAVLVATSVVLCVLTFPLSLFLVLKVIKQYECAIVFKLGRIHNNKARGPGVLLIIPCVDKVIRVDLRTKVITVPPQEVISKDSVPIHVDAVVYYRISDPILSVTNVADVQQATGLLAQTLLRNALGICTLADILDRREKIQQELQRHLDEATDVWGATVERIEFKDVRLPQTMQRAMAAEAEAAREARAKVVAAQGELNSARALKEAAEVISRSPTALKLRYLQTLNVIAAEGGSTIIFPLPIDMMVGGMGLPAGEPDIDTVHSKITLVRPKPER